MVDKKKSCTTQKVNLKEAQQGGKSLEPKHPLNKEQPLKRGK
jgi:hypothetical protein